MKIPKKLKVGGITYEITFNPKEHTSYLDREANIINLNPRLSHEQIRIALFHEILHAINCAITDEVLIEGLANGLHQVLHDNNLIRR